MERRTLGLTGLKLPVIGVGARSAFDAAGKEGQSARRSLVDLALSESANFFETSPESGDADGILASSLTGRRGRAIVAATISTGNPRLAHAQIDRALRLFEERVDILFTDGPAGWEAFQPVFQRMKSDGSLTAAGISCHDPADFGLLVEMLGNEPIDVLQVPYSPASQSVARNVLPLAARLDIGIIVGQPFGGGRLLDVAGAGSMLRRMRRYGVNDVAQTILKWILSDPRVTCVAPGTRRSAHLTGNLRAGRPPWMSPADRRFVSEHFRVEPA